MLLFTTVNSGAAPYDSAIRQAAKVNNIPPRLIRSIIKIESNWRANARGSSGEYGLMQIMPRTARGVGYRGNYKGLYNGRTNIKYGSVYLGRAYRKARGNICATAKYYNGGLGRNKHNRMTKIYCRKLLRVYGRPAHKLVNKPIRAVQREPEGR